MSLTVTKGGSLVNSTGQFEATAPKIAADGANPTRAATAFGAIVAVLKRHKAARTPPFTVMSCDNLPANGPRERA